jgi:hypothetical protein
MSAISPALECKSLCYLALQPVGLVPRLSTAILKTSSDTRDSRHSQPAAVGHDLPDADVAGTLDTANWGYRPLRSPNYAIRAARCSTLGDSSGRGRASSISLLGIDLHELIQKRSPFIDGPYPDTLVQAVHAAVVGIEEEPGDVIGWNSCRAQELGVRGGRFESRHDGHIRPELMGHLLNRTHDSP